MALDAGGRQQIKQALLSTLASQVRVDGCALEQPNLMQETRDTSVHEQW